MKQVVIAMVSAMASVLIVGVAVAGAATVYCPVSGTCQGTGGDDLIIGTGGADQINAGGGDDEIYGNNGKDTIHGNGGQDHIYPGGGGSAGYNIVYGDNSNDLIDGTVDTTGCPGLEVDGGDGEDSAWAFSFPGMFRNVEHWGTFAC